MRRGGGCIECWPWSWSAAGASPRARLQLQLSGVQPDVLTSAPQNRARCACLPAAAPGRCCPPSAARCGPRSHARRLSAVRRAALWPWPSPWRLACGLACWHQTIRAGSGAAIPARRAWALAVRTASVWLRWWPTSATGRPGPAGAPQPRWRALRSPRRQRQRRATGAGKAGRGQARSAAGHPDAPAERARGGAAGAAICSGSAAVCREKPRLPAPGCASAASGSWWV